ncbi:acyltransferase family protein [Adhaeribacter aerolatus]|uniref:acyltransferase family protein n=1 Tax=Adhaeribacter aerolatus TaxID=670289 RepID=UPI0011BD62DC|nr:acyltransferase [Adhaeribacter aerolatus]
MKQEKTGYFPALNGLRVFLASMVFVYHYSGLGNYDLTLSQILVVLRYRMTFFFVLSGFVIAYSLLSKLPLSGKQYLNFILSRLIRLLPLYLFLIVVPYIHVGIPAWPVFITNITLTKGFFEKLLFTGIGPAWSLTTEITFYLFAPFILKYFRTRKSILISYFLLVTTGLFLTLSGQYLNSIEANPFGFFSDIYFTLNITFFGRVTDFYAGMLLARLIYYFPDQRFLFLTKSKSLYAGVLLIIICCLLVYYFDNASFRYHTTLSLISLHLLLPFGVAYFLSGLIQGRSMVSKFFSYQWMVWLGNGAYGFYLMHNSWVQYKIQRINPFPDNGFILLWITAVMVYYIFEKPCILFLRKRLPS